MSVIMGAPLSREGFWQLRGGLSTDRCRTSPRQSIPGDAVRVVHLEFQLPSAGPENVEPGRSGGVALARIGGRKWHAQTGRASEAEGGGEVDRVERPQWIPADEVSGQGEQRSRDGNE